MEREYKRDKRSPKPKNIHVSKVMCANKAKGTQPEKELRHVLWSNEVRGYRLNYKKIPGTPDIVFISKKLALFVHGCYWHRCPYCNLKIPAHNSDFWTKKFEKNIERDNRKKLELEKLGWEVLTVWECKIKNDIAGELNRIKQALKAY